MYSKLLVLLSFRKIFFAELSAIFHDPEGMEFGAPMSAITPIKKPANIEYMFTRTSRALSVSNG